MPQQLHKTIEDVIERFSAAAGIPCRVEILDPESTHGTVSVRITTDEEARFLIGKNGQNLSALEHVIRAICYRQVGTEQRIAVDVNGYRHEREQQVIETTRAAVGQVRETGRPYTMPPMNAAERRIVHTELSDNTDVASESTGEDPFRRVVIKPVAL